ncbi:hypothetical protein BDV59DRAFT_211836 [Aspergillus ambiguus]|uniref:uncharacterized protein n=1 Tax=Aspergillus ambiguus TaxID=176160 RepID=UPI003CCE4CE5
MDHGCGLSGWRPFSTVIRAESRTGPRGPYTWAQELFGTFHHNPTVVWSPADKRYLIHFIGYDWEVPDRCTSIKRNNSISVSSSPDLRNWSNVTTLLDNVTNPAAWPLWTPKQPTPEMLLATEKNNIYHAQGYGGPYTLRVEPGFIEIDASLRSEDPFLWRDKRGHWHFLVHHMVDIALGNKGPRVGAHVFARDWQGPWHYNNITLAYNTTVEFTDGTTTEYYRRERPKLYFSDDGEMTPLYLINGGNMSTEDSLLSDLCTICHINAPKYRCPRCSTRTCSLPCSRRHKLWSQCSGVRDPAAYLRRNELATEAAFDRDFNFITGIERGLERAERDVENRGIRGPSGRSGVLDPAAVGLDHEVDSYDSGSGEKKRKRGGGDGVGLVKGEAGFLRGAEAAGVRVVRAPRGMSRNKANATRWHPKHKCLNWTVEWIVPDGERRNRSCLESTSIAEAYDRAFPLPKPDREQKLPEAEDPQAQDSRATPPPPPTITESTRPSAENTEPDQTSTPSFENSSYRDLYFYLHRPRTATKQPVLIPLIPGITLTSALRDRTVLEFPTIYVLPNSPETLRTTTEKPSFLLEEEYLQSQPQAELEQAGTTVGDTADGAHALGSADLTNVDESKVLEVLKKDLFEPVPAETTP